MILVIYFILSFIYFLKGGPVSCSYLFSWGLTIPNHQHYPTITSQSSPLSNFYPNHHHHYPHYVYPHNSKHYYSHHHHQNYYPHHHHYYYPRSSRHSYRDPPSSSVENVKRHFTRSASPWHCIYRVWRQITSSTTTTTTTSISRIGHTSD
ncbi:hypothetical protein E2C01_066980 [Portunus trituberculatus]|uniref:Uncharacterized protein n=1 Tax=Portunus trituberculatus TaxID=210409 RepID=A0A5B7HVD3_PORTR|nr:hypothetical protein [Portunus trituberculatus]